jgi:hypothetical protein
MADRLLPASLTSNAPRAGVNPDLSLFSREWRRLRTQKHRMRGGTEARIITNCGMWYGEHYMSQLRDTILTRPLGKDDERNKLWLVFNLMRKQARRKIGRLWSVAPEFRATPNRIDPRAFDQADVVNDLILGLDCKLRERWLQWRRLWWLVLGGVVVEHVPWIEDVEEEPLPRFDPESGELVWKDQQTGSELLQSQVEQLCRMGIPPERFSVVEELTTCGDVGSQIVSPLNFFIDSSVTSVDQLPPDGSCMIAEIKTVGWVREVFGSEAAQQIRNNSDLSIISTRLLDKGPSVANISLRDLLPAIQGSRLPDDPPMCIVITRYQPQCQDWPHGRRTIFVPDQVILDDDDTRYGEIPCIDIHFEPANTTFWTGDFMTDMIPGQKFLNKRMSQLGESANSQIYEVLLLGGELGKEDVPSDMPGIVEDGLDEQGQPRVSVLQRGQLPVFFLDSIKMIVEYIESIGSADLLSHRQFPGQLRGPLAIPMLQEILDSEDGPFFDHMGEQLARVKQMRVNRVKQFYPPIRTLHYTGRNMKNEVLVFHTESVLRAGTDFNVTVDRGSLLPELSALRHARVREDLESPIGIIYTNRRTGRIDPSKIAMALKYTDRAEEDREAEWRKLAQHIIAELWAGKGAHPDEPYPFWDHNAMMDEYESAMATTEWREASLEIKQGFLTLYDKHRQFLDQIQSAQQQSMQSTMMQSAVAQATQQTAAKVAAETVEASITQIREQADMARAMPPAQSVEAELNANARNPMGQPQSRLGPGQATRPPTRGLPPGPNEFNLQQLMGRG